MRIVQKKVSFKKLVVLITVLSVFFGTAWFSIDIGFAHISIHRIFVPIMMLICAQATLSNYNKTGKLLGTCRTNRYSLCFMLFWLGYAVLSCTWTPDINNGIRNVFFIFCGIISIFTFSFILKSFDDIYYCLFVIMFAVFIHSIIGWYEIFMGKYLFFVPQTEYIALINRPISSMTSENEFAMCILVGIFATYVIVKNIKSKLYALLAYAILLEESLILFVSFSRANIYGLILSFLILNIIDLKHFTRKVFMFLASLVILSIIVSIFMPNLVTFLNPQYFIDQMVIRITEGGNSDNIRKNLILNGLLFLLPTLGMGTGIGGIESYMASNGVYETYGITNIHNWWMEILVGSGIFIFAGYIIFYIKLCRDNYSRYKSKNTTSLERSTAFAFLGFMIAFIIASISSSSNMGNEILWVFWAIIIAFQGIKKQSQ